MALFRNVLSALNSEYSITEYHHVSSGVLSTVLSHMRSSYRIPTTVLCMPQQTACLYHTRFEYDSMILKYSTVRRH